MRCIQQSPTASLPAHPPACPLLHPLPAPSPPPCPAPCCLQSIGDDDLLALAGDEVHQPVAVWALQDLQVVCGSMGVPTATVRMQGPDGISRAAAGMGSGPVDAAYKVGAGGCSAVVWGGAGL